MGSGLSLKDVQYLVNAAGGSGAAFAAWRETGAMASQARRLDADLALALGVWSTPCAVDRAAVGASGRSSEPPVPYIGETTLPLLALHLRRRGCQGIPLSSCEELLAVRDVPRTPRAAGSTKKRLEVYVDLKSPYAYLAIEPTYALENDFNVELVWKPFVLNIPGMLGSAEVGAKDNKVKAGSNTRSSGQWIAVKYAYANIRRFAAERQPPLTVYGTQKIWNTTLAGLAMLFAERQGRLKAFQRRVWPKFWRRELDAEDTEVLAQVMRSAGVDTAGFTDFVTSEGPPLLAGIQREAQRHGVFGVPSYVLDGEMLFGREHLALLRHRLFQAGAAKNNGPECLKSPYLWTRNELFAGF